MPRTMTLNWMDWVTLAIVLVSILRGTRYGVWAGLGDLAALAASFFAASTLYPRGAAMLIHGFPMLPDPWAALIAFVIVWFGLYIVISALLRWPLGRIPFPASQILGGLLGGFRGLVLVTALLVVTLAAPFRGVVSQDAARSRVAPYLLHANDRIVTLLLPALPVRVPRIGPGGALF